MVPSVAHLSGEQQGQAGLLFGPPLSEGFSLHKHGRVMAVMGLQPPADRGRPWPTSLGVCCITGKGEGAEGHGAFALHPASHTGLYPHSQVTQSLPRCRVQGHLIHLPALKSPGLDTPSQLRSLLSAVTWDWPLGPSLLMSCLRNRQLLGNIRGSHGALRGDLLGQSPWGLGPPCRFPGLPTD